MSWLATELSFWVAGTPAPQGSKRHVGNGVMVESSKRVKPWRQDVKYAALQAIAELLTSTDPLAGPVSVHVSFYLPRPRAHYGTGKNATTLKATAPNWHDKRPDVDKLLRSTLDALGEAGLWRDDSQVALVTGTKTYGITAGARVVVRTLTPELETIA